MEINGRGTERTEFRKETPEENAARDRAANKQLVAGSSRNYLGNSCRKGLRYCSPNQGEHMSCGPPLSVEGGQDAEMPSQGEKMSCEPPLNGQGGQEGTNSDDGIEMEWKPDHTYTDFEPEGEEDMSVGEILCVLDKQGPEMNTEDLPAEIKNELNNVQLSQA